MELIDLICKKQWPIAIPEHLVVNNESDFERIKRANLILQNLPVNPCSRSLLDVFPDSLDRLYLALSLGASKCCALGMPENLPLLYPQNNRINLYKAIHDIKEKYDLIMIWNSHLDSMNSDVFLKLLADMLNPRGLIHWRFVPWTSRLNDASLKSNKAFAHIFRSDNNLQNNMKKSLPAFYPDMLIDELNLKIIHKQIWKKDPEKLFRTPLLRTKLVDFLGSRWEEVLSIVSIDYVVGKNDN